jgi:hypothetical protein
MYLFRKIVFNCKQATILSLKKEEGKISLNERLKLSDHLLYCKVCRNFIRQSHDINRSGKAISESLFTNPPFSLTEERKQAMQRQLDAIKQ